MIVPTPQWVVTVVIYDREGNTDHWTEVLTEPGLNRRQAISRAIEGLPGAPADPLLQRMLAWNLEANASIHIPSARVRVVASVIDEARQGVGNIHIEQAPTIEPDLDDRPTVTVRTADILDLAVRGCDLMAGGGDTWLPGVDASSADRWWFDMKVAAGIEDARPSTGPCQGCIYCETAPTDNPVTRAIREHVPHFGRDDADLLKSAIIYGSAHYTGKPRWAAVASLFGVGSTVAHHLCIAAGIDPDQVGEPDPAEVSHG